MSLCDFQYNYQAAFELEIERKVEEKERRNGKRSD